MSRTLFRYHPRYGHLFLPSQKARVQDEGGGYLVRTNAAGFRCAHEVTAARPEGQRRVLLFGDSFTAGDGVSNKHRFGDRLEALRPGLQVLNFGLPGSGTDQQYLIGQDFAPGPELQADAVVLAVQVENIRRVAARWRPYVTGAGAEEIAAKPYFTLEGGALALHNVPVPKERYTQETLPAEAKEHLDTGGRFAWLRGLVNTVAPGLKETLQRASKLQPLPEYDDPEGDAWRVMRALLTEWIGALEVPVVLFVVPLYHYVEELADPAGYRARFSEVAAATGATLVDPLDHLQARPAAERRALRFDSHPHPTRDGHAALAAVLAEGLDGVLGANATTQAGAA